MVRSLKALVGISLLAGLFYFVPLGKFLDVIGRVSVTGLLLALVITTCGMIVSSWKLYVVLPQLGISSRFVNVLRAYYLGTFFNNFIPTSVGGDVIKTDVIRRLDGANARSSSLAVLFERASGLILLAFIALVFLVITPSRYLVFLKKLEVPANSPSSLFTGGIILGLVTLGLLYFFWNRSTLSWVQSYLSTFWKFPLQNPVTVGYLFGLSLIFHGLKALCLVVLTKAFGSALFFLDAIFILPVIAFASFLPISFGGLGLRETVVTFCLHSTGISLEIALAVSLTYRLVTAIHSLAGGLIYLLEPLNPHSNANKNSLF